MTSASSHLTRRDLLRRGLLAAGAMAVAGSLGELALGAQSSGPQPPGVPRWLTRPDLRIPALTVTRRRSGVSEDPIFIAPYNAPKAQAGAVIAANSGEAIWEHPLPGKVTTNFRVQRYRGSPVLVWWEGTIELGHGVGEYVIADSSYRMIRRVKAARGLRGDLHEFVITTRDTALLTSYVVRNADLREVGGAANGTIQDAIFQEIDLANGRVLIEWHSLGNIPLRESYAPVGGDWDFFHINSVDLDTDGNFLVSSRSTHTVYKIDRGGRIRWRLGGRSSNFELGPGVSFAWQHHVRRQSDGTLTMLDNGATPAVEKLSRGLILDLDERAMTASLQRQFTHAKVLSGSQGSVQKLPNGNVFVGWGEIPRVSEFDPDGRLVFDALLGKAYQSYRAYRLPWGAVPAEAPALAVSAANPRRAYASWNGATGVGSWRLLGGSAPDSLSVLGESPAKGFETELPTQGSAAHIAVEALDAQRRPLGRSAVIPT
jgi:Arylsulfotransferase (ASST)